MIVYGISNCDTVRKARRWLADRNVDFQFHDFRKDGLDKGTISQWCQTVDWQMLLNRRSTSWRKLDNDLKQDLDQAKCIELMLEHPTLIKRPVIVHDERVFVGFSKDTVAQLAQL